MFIDVLNKVLMVLFFISCLNTLRHGYYFIQAYISTDDETPKKYILSQKSLFLLGTSIAYILTTIFSGIRL